MMNMKTKLLGLMTLMGSAAIMASTPVKKVVPVEYIYSPRGYDTLDTSEVVIKGYLPNECHKSPKITHKIENKKIFMEVTSLYYQQPNTFCPQAILPFVKTIDLGLC